MNQTIIFYFNHITDTNQQAKPKLSIKSSWAISVFSQPIIDG